MTDPVPPKKSSARKWVLWGCGCGLLLFIVLGGVFGFVFWQIKKAADELSGIGSAYLSSRPEVSAEIGTVQKVEGKPLQMNVQVRNDQGEAWFGYSVTGQKGTADAEVWLVKRGGGPWQPAGAKLYAGGKTVLIGTPGAPPGSNLKD